MKCSKLHSCYQYWWESALYGVWDMPGSSGCTGKYSNIYIDGLWAILDHFYSAWGPVGDVDVLEGPIYWSLAEGLA